MILLISTFNFIVSTVISESVKLTILFTLQIILYFLANGKRKEKSSFNLARLS